MSKREDRYCCNNGECDGHGEPERKFETTKIEVCTDCAMMIANAELGQGDEAAEQAHSDRMVAIWGEGRDGVLGLILTLGEDDEAFFSWQDCDGCGSNLGGDRLDAVYMVEVTS